MSIYERWLILLEELPFEAWKREFKPFDWSTSHNGVKVVLASRLEPSLFIDGLPIACHSTRLAELIKRLNREENVRKHDDSQKKLEAAWKQWHAFKAPALQGPARP